MADRMLKINELVNRQLGLLINQEAELPIGSIATITKVKTSKDLSRALVFVSVLPADQKEAVMRILIHQAKNLQHWLNEKIVLRKIPKLRFILDESGERAQDIEYLLDHLE